MRLPMVSQRRTMGAYASSMATPTPVIEEQWEALGDLEGLRGQAAAGVRAASGLRRAGDFSERFRCATQ